MEKKKGRKTGLMFVLVLCLLGALFAQDGWHAVERWVYPQKYSEYVEYYAAKYSMDSNRVYALIRTESGFDPKAESEVGARGLMQITEETFSWIKTKIAPEESVTFDDLYDPEANIRFGVYLLAVCLERYQGDFSTAAAAYHSGIGMVDGLLKDAQYSADGQMLHTFPYKQMRNYVNKIQGNYQKYTMLYAN